MQLNFAPEAQPTGVQARLAQVLNLVRIGYQYGFIPYVIYLGLKKGADPGMPPIGLQNILW